MTLAQWLRPVLPDLNFIDNGVGNFGNQSRRNVGVVHFFKGVDNVAGGHATVVKNQNFVIHAGKPALDFLYQGRFKCGIVVVGRSQFDGPGFCTNGFGGIVVASIMGFFRSQMMLQFGV